MGITMKIDEAIARCQNDNFDKQKFLLIVPSGVKNCKMLDAYFGFFEIEGSKGFLTAESIRDIPHDIHFIEPRRKNGINEIRKTTITRQGIPG